MHKGDAVVIRVVQMSLLACWLALVFAPSVLAADTKVGGPTAAPASAETTRPAAPAIPAQPAPPPVNPVTQAAVQAGVLTCVGRINQVVTFLTANSKSAAFLFVPQRQPDQCIFSVSLGMEGEKTTNKYASASFAPTTNGQVSAVYDSVEYVALSPAEVETKTFKDLKRKGNLGKDIVVLDGGTVAVFLMPAGSGCIIIKKEVVQ